MKLFKNITYLTVIWFLLFMASSCEQENFEPELAIADGAGTLTNFKAYTLESIVGVADSVYGRVVFWEDLNEKTLVQVSLYNHPDIEAPNEVIFESSIMMGSVTAPGSEMMELYDIANTGEGHSFGEFATSKYFVITDTDFFTNLSSLDAHVVIENDGIIVAQGDIGMNTKPVEEN